MKINKYVLNDDVQNNCTCSELEERSQSDRGVAYAFDSYGNVIGTRQSESAYDEIYIGGFGSNCICSPLNCNLTISSYGSNSHEITGGGEEVYKFLANHTTVEWAGSYNGSGSENNWTINTSHSSNGVEAEIVPGDKTHVHSHRGDSATPSNTDLEAKDNFLDAGYENFKIYNPSNGQYTSY